MNDFLLEYTALIAKNHSSKYVNNFLNWLIDNKKIPATENNC